MKTTDPDHAEPHRRIARLLELKRISDAEIIRRSRRGQGPAGYLSKTVRTHDCVHVIWRDDAASGGYDHLIVPNPRARPARKALREAVFETEDRQRAEELAHDFGAGTFPIGDDWVLVLRIADPDGGPGPDGRPPTMVVMDASPSIARGLSAHGHEVRGY